MDRGGGRVGQPIRVALVLVLLAATSWVVALVVSGHGPARRTGTAAARSTATGTAATRSPATANPTAPGSATPSRSGADARMDGCVTALLARLSLERQAGQLLMVGTPVDGPQPVGDTVARYGIGGVFLAGRSSRPAAGLRRDIQQLQQRASGAAVLPLQVALDQEGGQVQTLQGADFPPIPPATEQGLWTEATLRSRTADWTGRLAGIGITMDLAPVADTVPPGTADRNPPIGAYDRQYGGDPDAVARDVATVVSAMQAGGVLATLKHFPGLGRVTANTDTSDQAVDAVTTVADPFLKPFRAGVEAGAGAVMVSSARYPGLDRTNVAAFSAPVITGLLRERLGFTGLVISDDLGAAAAVDAVPVGQRIVRFVAAGGDMTLTVRATDVPEMIDSLVDAARASASFQARISDAAASVLRSKYRAGLLTCPTSGAGGRSIAGYSTTTGPGAGIV